MQPRRSLRLVAGALVLALPLLSSCGFGKATDRPYTPAAGTNNRDGDVKVLSAVVVSAQPGSGTFIVTLSNNTADRDTEVVALEELSGAGDWTDLEIGDFEPIEVPRRAYVNLADDGGIPVVGDLVPGDFIDLTLSFDSGQATTMELPVVYACNEWSGLDTSVLDEALGVEAEPSESPSPGDVPTEGATPVETETATPEDVEPYDCSVVLEEH